MSRDSGAEWVMRERDGLMSGTSMRDPSWTVSLMDKYGAKYLFVGDMEQELYTVALPENGLTRIFAADDVSIYQRSN